MLQFQGWWFPQYWSRFVTRSQTAKGQNYTGLHLIYAEFFWFGAWTQSYKCFFCFNWRYAEISTN